MSPTRWQPTAPIKIGKLAREIADEVWTPYGLRDPDAEDIATATATIYDRLYQASEWPHPHYLMIVANALVLERVLGNRR